MKPAERRLQTGAQDVILPYMLSSRFLAWTALAAAPMLAQTTEYQLHVDATDAPRRLFHVRMTVPAKPGPMTLLYPKWIPGEHMPSGPISDLVGLKVQASGQSLPWKRDNVDMFAFHVDVPAGVTILDVAFDFISPPDTGGYTSGSSTTSELAVLNWNQLVLYPQGVAPDQLQYHASLRVPDSWRYGSALPIQHESGNEIEFKPAPLTTLIDSPISMGRHYKTIDLGSPDGIPHYLNLAADSDRAAEIPQELVAEYRNLVLETGALYGSRHYRDYHFLLTLSDHVAHFGLEHHESSDDRVAERTLIDDAPRKMASSLLPHEFTHSWNGKFRRPAGLATGNYESPMKGDLLWVYEGLTNYLGEILAPRSGLLSPTDYREALARTAADLDTEAGRAWRPLEDTAIGAQILYEARDDYAEYRRSVDYYPEGSLIWLDADVTIRRLSNGSKSLNDFCRAFLGGPGGAPALKPYHFEDIVAALSAVQPYDWAGFLNQRLHSTDPHAPLGGIQNGGWKLVYNATPSDMWKAYEEYRKVIDLSYSLGLVVMEDGSIRDVKFNGLAKGAGLAPAQKIIAVDGRQFNPTVLRDAVEAATHRSEPMELLIKDGEYYKTYRIDYHGGPRYPHLERDASKPDLLSAVIAPLAKH
ncbi:MAG TPA: hypothetical protein VKU01_08570 [Bryobacteraceae bacterium]|nr:hypothetical protein [Bryobacteraceae bacterium]